jgi:hypothetical protein
VEPELEQYLAAAGVNLNPATTGAMMNHLHSWVAAGSHRRRASHGDSQYDDPAAVATMDELEPHLIGAVFNSLFCANPASCTGTEVYSINGLAAGFAKHPMGWTDLPSGRGGSAYDGGWEGYMLKVLRQLHGGTVGQPFSNAMMANICDGGAPNCKTAITQAITDTYNAMKTDNAGSTTVPSWTMNDNLVYCSSHSCPTKMPEYDNISYTGVGVISQPDMDWQNRPTFQQVADFTRHRARNAGSSGGPGAPGVGSLPNTTAQRDLGPAVLIGVVGAALAVAASRRRRRRALRL